MERKLDDWLDGFIKYCENSEPPESYKRWVGISVIAAALQRKVVLPWGHLKFYPNMYIVLVGPPGRTRKGTAMTPGYQLLSDVGIKIAAEATTRESLIQQLESASATHTTPDGRVIYHASLTVFSQELTVFLGFKNQQLIMDLTDWYDCKPRWVYRTKNMGTNDIVGVWVNLIGATTPELLQTSLPRDAIGGGLTSRIVFIYEDRKGKTVPFPMLTDEALRLYNDLLEDLNTMSTLAGDFYPDQSFLKAYEQWYLEQEKLDLFPGVPELQGYVERRPNHILKLSMILSASRSNEMVLLDYDLHRAVRYLEEAENKIAKVYAGVGKSPVADVTNAIMEYIARKKKVPVRELLRTFYRDVGEKDQLLRIVATIEYTGFISLTRDSEDGELYAVYIAKEKKEG